MAYREEGYGGYEGDTALPDAVQTFVTYLYRHIREKNVYEIHQMYEGSFNKITDRMFKQTPWPPVEAVAPYVDNDHVFCLLYKELYYRHVYARLQPTLDQRAESWDNYCALFQVILHGNVNMQLPNQWLWDMVDEFIYQFQSFCQFRAKLKSRSEEELTLLRQYDQVWNVFAVLNYLQAMIDTSEITALLADPQARDDFTATDGYDYSGGSNVLRMLGYLSIVGLLRVHSLLGDYHGALKCLEPIDINLGGVFTRIAGCHVTTMYYSGFAYLMLRRYVDAIKVFNAVLVYIGRTKQYLQQSPQIDQLLKKNEQMYALLAICLSLCPQQKLVEDNVLNSVREKFGEKMGRMQQPSESSSESTFDDLFSLSCPKFITPSSPNWNEPLTNYNQDAYRLQLKVFLGDVKQQAVMAHLRSLLKLYTSIPIAKLATLMGGMDEYSLRNALLSFKHKTNVVDSTDGSILPTSDIDFYIDEDMVHIAEGKSTRRFGDYFVRHIGKCEEIVHELEACEVIG